jgi:hypothetical protein
MLLVEETCFIIVVSRVRRTFPRKSYVATSRGGPAEVFCFLKATPNRGEIQREAAECTRTRLPSVPVDRTDLATVGGQGTTCQSL